MSLAILALLLAGISPPGDPSQRGFMEPCRLLTRDEVGKVAGGRIAETKATRRVAGSIEVADCFYRAERFDGSVSLEMARSAKASEQRVRERWRAVFYGEANREGEGEAEESSLGEASGKEKAPPPRPIEGLGDEAFWLGNPASGVLYVLKGDRYLRISVGGAGDDGVKQRKATDLARQALRRM